MDEIPDVHWSRRIGSSAFNGLTEILAMSNATYVQDLKRRLDDLEARMEEDRKRLASGGREERVEAAGDLGVAEQRLAETRRKLSRLKNEPRGAWEDLKTELEEDLDHIELAIERWAARL